jgi:L-amino acid N-acyltransferase YncA
MIRNATENDAEAITGIYNHYISNTVITFEEAVVAAPDIAQRIRAIQTAGLPWLIAEENNTLIGYAYASPWHYRSAYQFSVETSVYLDPKSSGKGWGIKLYHALFSALEKTNIHTVISGIALPNPASIALHEKFGMIKTAHFNEVGYKLNRWVDVGYWQLNLASVKDE